MKFEVSNFSESGFSLIEIVLTIALVAVMGGAAFLAFQAQDKVAVTSTSTPKASASASPSPSAPTPTPTNVYAGWKTFTSSVEKLSFKYPADWTAERVKCSPACPNIDTFYFRSPGGTRVVWSSDVDGLGSGECNLGDPHVVVESMKEIPGISGAYLAELSMGNRHDLVVADVKKTSPALKIGDAGKCTSTAYYPLFSSKDGARAMGFQTFFGTGELKIADAETVKLMMLSLSY
jgi:prepilin-type N-terminal cleavage/methylation domain-containing protein